MDQALNSNFSIKNIDSPSPKKETTEAEFDSQIKDEVHQQDE